MTPSPPLLSPKTERINNGKTWTEREKDVQEFIQAIKDIKITQATGQMPETVIYSKEQFGLIGMEELWKIKIIKRIKISL